MHLPSEARPIPHAPAVVLEAILAGHTTYGAIHARTGLTVHRIGAAVRALAAEGLVTFEAKKKGTIRPLVVAVDPERAAS